VKDQDDQPRGRVFKRFPNLSAQHDKILKEERGGVPQGWKGLSSGVRGEKKKSLGEYTEKPPPSCGLSRHAGGGFPKSRGKKMERLKRKKLSIGKTSRGKQLTRELCDEGKCMGTIWGEKSQNRSRVEDKGGGLG